VAVAQTPRADRMVAPAALGRAVLLGRAAVTVTAASAGLRLVDDPGRLGAVLAIVVLTTVVGLAVLSRRPSVVRRPVPILVADALIVLGVLVASRGGVAYFCCAIGASALAGVLLGMRALGLWAAYAALGYAVVAGVLHGSAASADIAAFVVAFPMAGVLAGIGAAVATGALVRYVDLSVGVVASAQRSAAAAERARLARELHDSVTKTLRGVSFAALALPSSLRRHPSLAEQLAATVSEGATAAATQARELLEGLRMDAPDQGFSETVRDICLRWTDATRIPVLPAVAVVEPSIEARYELIRILQEALRNVARHAHARQVEVGVELGDAGVRLWVRDDGVGFPMPDDTAALRAEGHFGILGMSERARSVHGRLRITSSPGRGTTVEVWAPIGEEAAAADGLPPIGPGGLARPVR
jgi:signal transduction histidine kinase